MPAQRNRQLQVGWLSWPDDEDFSNKLGWMICHAGWSQATSETASRRCSWRCGETNWNRGTTIAKAIVRQSRTPGVLGSAICS